ncbi:MAG: hypothetical protein DRP91_04815 [Candidatus Neomarinimicrobiota bacterium]|nr:MAG: hypothetical protein DRP91_04815 [Candidatus Neomarinimicrobiota bacterium]
MRRKIIHYNTPRNVFLGLQISDTENSASVKFNPKEDYSVSNKIKINFSIDSTESYENPESEICLGSKAFPIYTLVNKRLKKPLMVILESDDGGYIARSVDLPMYGYGDDAKEAIENLKYEIESLYNDLMADDNFSDEWLRYKSFLMEIVY